MKAIVIVVTAAAAALAAPASPVAPPPSRVLQDGASRATVAVGAGSTVVGSSSLGVETFDGIPFAQPPVGDGRLRRPQRRTSPLGTLDATGTAASCPQMFFSTEDGSPLTQVLGNLIDTPLFQRALDVSEDCLTLKVQRPAGTRADAKLPVLFWIFGGGFELGATSMYDGAGLVSQGVQSKQPFVFVAVNYRTGGFGFMPGKEILADGAANLGLLDQRMGLEWVADNIAAFGGDAARVTMWGESAGAISQMVLYGGDSAYQGQPLFRGAIMNSGSIVPADPIDCPKGQEVFDAVAAEAGCASAGDPLACLRAADYDTFLRAANSVPGILSYDSVALSYLPRPDGAALPASPDELVRAGAYAAVPMMVGDQEDEGTLFALFQRNLSSGADVVDYLSAVFFRGATREQVAELVDTYDASPAAGSPFRTGAANNVYPVFKRLAALLGDLVFTLTRRAFLEAARAAHPEVPSWSYLASYDYGTPVLGSFRGGDILQVFYGVLPDYAGRTTRAYYLNFLYDLDPNVGTAGLMAWPQWGENRKLMNFFSAGAKLLADDFRSKSYDWIVANVGSLHI